MIDIYLIRHGKPDFPDSKSYCIGTTDILLGTAGNVQAGLLGLYFKGSFDRVYSSPLIRAAGTAAYLSPSHTVVPELRERSMGDWDGLSFDEIRQRWPDIYEKRGYDMCTPIPGAEAPSEAAQRFYTAVKAIADESLPGERIALVAHADVISLFIHKILGIEYYSGNYKLPYCGFHHLQYDEGSGDFLVKETSQRAKVGLTPDICRRIWDFVDLPIHIREHCEAVAEYAIKIADAINFQVTIDKDLLRRSALMHDILRTHRDHAAAGAGLLKDLGFDAEADIVRAHHDYDGDIIDERAILFIADKCLQGTTPVSVDERFERSLVKCTSDEARAAHERRYKRAVYLRDLINSSCGYEII